MDATYQYYPNALASDFSNRDTKHPVTRGATYHLRQLKRLQLEGGKLIVDDSSSNWQLDHSDFKEVRWS